MDNQFVEPLEDRIAPATLVNASTVSFQDVDGDTVTVKFSKAIFANTAQADSVFTFSNGDAFSGNNLIATQLQSIDLSNLTNANIQGVDITISAKKVAGSFGDARANVGEIVSSGVNSYDLGKVKINGDLGRILAGDLITSTAAIKSLSVGTIGAYGEATQIGGGNLVSTLTGGAGTVSVTGDVKGAEFNILGNLNSLTIGGSLVAGYDALSGLIAVTGSVGKMLIKGNIVGGVETQSGFVSIGGQTGNFTVGGGLFGASGTYGATIFIDNNVTGTVKIGGNIVGSAGTDTGVVVITGTANKVIVGGSLIGGSGDRSGQIDLQNGATLLSIGKDLVGGSGLESGLIEVATGKSLGSLTIKGSVIGNSGISSGTFFAPDAFVAKTTVGGNLIGGAAINTGLLIADFGNFVKIGGSVIGGGGTNSGSIADTGSAVTTITQIAIKGDLRGSDGAGSGLIFSEGILNVSVGKSIIGGSGLSSGGLHAIALGFQKIVVGGDVIGGSAQDSGYILGNPVGAMPISEITVKGSVIGGSATSTGVISIVGGGTINKLTIGKDVIGSSLVGAGTNVSSGSVFIDAAFVKSASIGGSIIAGSLNGAGILERTGMVVFGGGADKVAIKGGLTGSLSHQAELRFGVLAAPTPTNYQVVKTLTIGGSVTAANILAGYDALGVMVGGGNVAIGKLQIGGNLIGSNIAVGVQAGADQLFGTDDDSLIDLPTLTSRIASLVVKGFAGGSDNVAQQFGVVAAQFGSVKIGKTNFPTSAGIGFPLDRTTMPPLNGSVVIRTY